MPILILESESSQRKRIYRVREAGCSRKMDEPSGSHLAILFFATKKVERLAEVLANSEVDFLAPESHVHFEVSHTIGCLAE